jgi:hypothetical protein
MMPREGWKGYLLRVEPETLDQFEERIKEFNETVTDKRDKFKVSTLLREFMQYIIDDGVQTFLNKENESL